MCQLIFSVIVKIFFIPMKMQNREGTPTPNFRPFANPIHICKRAFTGLAAKRETWRMSALLLLVPLGSFVARAKALPDAVTYELSHDAGNLFAINSTTGIISVQDRFDREVCRTLYYISLLRAPEMFMLHNPSISSCKFTFRFSLCQSLLSPQKNRGGCDTG